MSRPFAPRPPSGPQVRVNGKIRAREVRVIGPEGQQVGVLQLHEAISMARAKQMDLVEVAPNATPPVCRIVDYGKFRYEQAKREKESKKHQHVNKLKEIQLSASIDPHDFSIKVGHSIDFLCEDMQVKASLRFRGREMIHQEFGRQVMDNFLKDLAPYGVPDSPPRLMGRGLNVILRPLPRNKRAKNPRAESERAVLPGGAERIPGSTSGKPVDDHDEDDADTDSGSGSEGGSKPQGFANSPFSQIDPTLGGQSAA